MCFLNGITLLAVLFMLLGSVSGTIYSPRYIWQVFHKTSTTRQSALVWSRLRDYPKGVASRIKGWYRGLFILCAHMTPTTSRRRTHAVSFLINRDWKASVRRPDKRSTIGQKEIILKIGASIVRSIEASRAREMSSEKNVRCSRYSLSVACLASVRCRNET